MSSGQVSTARTCPVVCIESVLWCEARHHAEPHPFAIAVTTTTVSIAIQYGVDLMRLVEYMRAARHRHQTRQVEQRGEALAANGVFRDGNEAGG